MPENPALPAWLSTVLTIVLTLVILTWRWVLVRKWRGRPALPRRRRPRVPWGIEGGMLAAFFLLNALASFFIAPPEPTGEINNEVANEIANDITIDVMDVVAQTAVFVVLVVVSLAVLSVSHSLKWGRSVLRWEYFGLGGSPLRMLGDLPLGVLATAAMLPLVYAVSGLLYLISPPTPHPVLDALQDAPSPQTLAALVFLAVVLAPLVEELAFRVLLQGGLERLAGRRSWWPIVISSLAFAVSHTNQGYAPLPLFVLAMGIGYVYRQTGSYPAVVAMHMAFNGLSLAVAYGAPLPEAS